MFSRNKAILAFIILSAVAVPLIAASNQSSNQGGFGEFAGQLIYNLTPGSSQVEYWTLINKFNYPFSFYVAPPQFNKSGPTPPIITFSVTNGIIPANSNLTIAVNVTAPGWTSYIFSSKPAKWSEYATAYAQPTANSGGAAISLGTAKLIQVTIPPPHVLIPLAGTAIIIVVAALAAGAYFRSRGRRAAKAAVSRTRAVPTRRAARRRATRSRKGKGSRKRKGARRRR